MFEITDRDGAARLGRWELPSGEVPTPAVLHPATDRHPPPDWAEVVLARRDPGTGPWIRHGGSAFVPEEGEGGDARVPAALAYPTRVGRSTHEAATRENPGDGPVSVVSARTPEPPEGTECMVVPGLAPLLDRPRRLARTLVRVRRPAFQAALHLPGIGRPQDLALLAYTGVDLFDAVPCRLAARRGRFLTPEGSLPADEAARETCPCPGCLGEADGPDWLLEHNLHAQRAELARVRQAIAAERLRDLVETRVHARPEAVACLRHLDRRHHAFFETRTPVHRNVPMPAPSRESLHRPEVRRYRERLRERYTPPETADVLLLLPCSAYKPYVESRTHRRLRRVVGNVPNRWSVHEVVVTSPLGVVPRELERIYPAAQYDLPVTGDWTPEERQLIRDGLDHLLKTGTYDHVVVHLVEDEAAIVGDVLPKAEETARGDPRSAASLEALDETLRAVTSSLAEVAYRERLREELAAIARFQFGPKAEALLEDVRTDGSWPSPRLMDGDEQVAALVGTRGRYTLALEGGRRLAQAGAHRVEIEDFHPEGSVFAVGVTDADPGICVEDDAVCVHDDEVRAVGRAAMCGPEMAESDRGVAVEVKHRA